MTAYESQHDNQTSEPEPDISHTLCTHIHTHTRTLGFGAPNGRLTEICKVTTADSTLTPLCLFFSYVYSIKFTHGENNRLFD